MIKLNLKFQEKPNVVGVVLLFILTLVVNLAIGFGVCAGCTYLACMFFGLNWSVEFAAGVFFVMVMLWWFLSDTN